MSDVTIHVSGEFMLAHVEGTTPEAIDFIDEYLPDGDLVVVDSGRIIIPADSLETFTAECARRRLEVEEYAAAI